MEVMEGRYAAEREARVAGEGGGGRRTRDGRGFGILRIYWSEAGRIDGHLDLE
jgi:hypothetical protein